MAFHINPKNGNVNKCSAREGKCPFGTNAPHFEKPEDARQFYEDKMLAHTFQKAKEIAKGPGIVPLQLRADYTFMMARRGMEELKEDLTQEAILLASSMNVSERSGPRGGSPIETVKKLGLVAQNFARIPIVGSAALRLFEAARSIPQSALTTTPGLLITSGVIAVGPAVGVGYFGKRAFTDAKRELLA